MTVTQAIPATAMREIQPPITPAIVNRTTQAPTFKDNAARQKHDQNKVHHRCPDH
jgi:hypothetical protein